MTGTTTHPLMSDVFLRVRSSVAKDRVAAADSYKYARDMTRMMAEAIFSPSKFKKEWRPDAPSMWAERMKVVRDGRSQTEASRRRLGLPDDDATADPKGVKGSLGGSAVIKVLQDILNVLRQTAANKDAYASAYYAAVMGRRLTAVRSGVVFNAQGQPISPRQGAVPVSSPAAIAATTATLSRMPAIMGAFAGVIGTATGVFDVFFTKMKGVFNNAWAAMGLSGLMSRMLAPVGKTLMNVIAPALLPLQKFFIDLILNTVAPFIYKNMPAIQNFFMELTTKAIPALQKFAKETMPLIIEGLKQVGKLVGWAVEHPKTTAAVVGGSWLVQTIGSIALNLAMMKLAMRGAATGPVVTSVMTAMQKAMTTWAAKGAPVAGPAVVGMGAKVLAFITGAGIISSIAAVTLAAGGGVLIGWLLNKIPGVKDGLAWLNKKSGMDYALKRMSGLDKAEAYQNEADKDYAYARKMRKAQLERLNYKVPTPLNKQYGDKFGSRPDVSSLGLPAGVAGFTWPAEMQGTPFTIKDAPQLIGPASGMSKPAANPALGEVRDSVGSMHQGLAMELRGLRADLRRTIRGLSDPMVTSMMEVA